MSDLKNIVLEGIRLDKGFFDQKTTTKDSDLPNQPTHNNNKPTKNLSPEEYVIIKEKFPAISYLEEVHLDFLKVFSTKDLDRLDNFITKYEQSECKNIKTFANGLKKDYHAVALAVTTPLSNGFYEGTNNKIKAFCRQAYGRCSDALLNAKMTLSHIFIRGSKKELFLEETRKWIIENIEKIGRA